MALLRQLLHCDQLVQAAAFIPAHLCLVRLSPTCEVHYSFLKSVTEQLAAFRSGLQPSSAELNSLSLFGIGFTAPSQLA